MSIEVHLTDDDIDRIARRVARLAGASATRAERWLDVPAAASHLLLTEDAIRGLVKRQRIPFYRTENGRLRFSAAELDGWVRTRACAMTHEDLP